jgi:hypothetical protein
LTRTYIAGEMENVEFRAAAAPAARHLALHH